MSCDFSDDRLIVSGATPALIPADTEVAFTLSGFKNPIETGYVDGFKISTRVRSGSNFYVVDEDVSSLTVSEYATLSNAKLLVKDPDGNPLAGIIQEVNDMKLDFFLPVPLNEGCKVNVALPEEYSVSEIQRVMTHNAFGYYQNYTENLGNLFIDLDYNSFSIEACKTYVENSGTATITMFSLTQPNYEAATKSVRIQINTKNDGFVAMIDEGVTFTPTRGNITVESDALNYTVQSPTMVIFTLQP